MRLTTYILNNMPQITCEWESFARRLIPASTEMTPLALRDHITEILEFIVRDMELPQSKHEQEQKSYGEGRQNDEVSPSAAETHAIMRFADGFSLDQMVSEYRALRASVIKLWKRSTDTYSGDNVEEIVRFNETIDQALAESVSISQRMSAAQAQNATSGFSISQ